MRCQSDYITRDDRRPTAVFQRQDAKMPRYLRFEPQRHKDHEDHEGFYGFESEFASLMTTEDEEITATIMVLDNRNLGVLAFSRFTFLCPLPTAHCPLPTVY